MFAFQWKAFIIIYAALFVNDDGWKNLILINRKLIQLNHSLINSYRLTKLFAHISPMFFHLTSQSYRLLIQLQPNSQFEFGALYNPILARDRKNNEKSCCIV